MTEGEGTERARLPATEPADIPAARDAPLCGIHPRCAESRCRIGDARPHAGNPAGLRTAPRWHTSVHNSATMTAGDICTRPVVTADRDETIVEAARRMRDRHVGALVVVDASQRPLGILTDRDIVVLRPWRKVPASSTACASAM